MPENLGTVSVDCVAREFSSLVVLRPTWGKSCSFRYEPRTHHVRTTAEAISIVA